MAGIGSIKNFLVHTAFVASGAFGALTAPGCSVTFQGPRQFTQTGPCRSDAEVQHAVQKWMNQLCKGRAYTVPSSARCIDGHYEVSWNADECR